MSNLYCPNCKTFSGEGLVRSLFGYSGVWHCNHCRSALVFKRDRRKFINFIRIMFYAGFLYLIFGPIEYKVFFVSLYCFTALANRIEIYEPPEEPGFMIGSRRVTFKSRN